MLKVGIAKIDITPPLGTRLAGYGIPERPAEEVLDPLYATAIVFKQGRIKAAHVTLDLCLVGNEDTERMRSLAAKRSDIPAKNINVGTTHTHSGPQTMTFEGWGDKDQAYLKSLIPRVAKAVAKANKGVVPVRVGIGTTETRVGINRRAANRDHVNSMAVSACDDGPYDSTMTVVRFEGKDGPVATLIHASAHGTAMGANRLVSRDWPGVMIDRVESQTKAPAIFINGSFGDTGPRTNYVLEPGAFSAGVGDGIHAVNEVGYRGASDALWTYQGIKHFADDYALKVCTETLQLPLAPLPTLEEAQAKLKEFEPQKNEWGSGMCNYRYWKRVIAAHGKPAPSHRPFRQTVIALGPVALVPLPGEPFTSINLRTRRFSPFQHTLTCGSTNGWIVYIPDREGRHRGGYETWVGIGALTYLLADDIDDAFVSGNTQLLEDLAKS
ncbi:MAG: hypothetical protein GY851_10995 [bacterium]|nr:hypothetical protein [bacterium]